MGHQPLTLGARGMGSDPDVTQRCRNVTHAIDTETARYGWRRRLLNAPIVEAYTSRDVRTHVHDLKVATYGIAGGIGGSFLIDWIRSSF